jgi:hypothetical protein
MSPVRVMCPPARADALPARFSRPPSTPGTPLDTPRPVTISGEPIPRVVGGILGLTGFSTALFIGMAAGNPATTTLGRGLLSMIVCYIVGRMLGSMGSAAVGEYIEKYKADRPAPEPPSELVELQNQRNRHKQIVEEMKRAA